MERNTSIADQVFEQIEREILSGEYNRGDILTETKLSEKLAISRTPVREAMRRLEQEHIIEMTTKGAMVIGISKEDIALIYEMRVRLEGLAGAMAAVNASDDDIEKLRSIVSLQEFYTQRGEADNIKNTDNDFHRMFYRMSGSVPLCDTLCDLHKKVLKYRRASVTDRSRAENSLAEHKAILEAIAAHDANAAEATVVLHVKNARDRLSSGRV